VLEKERERQDLEIKKTVSELLEFTKLARIRRENAQDERIQMWRRMLYIDLRDVFAGERENRVVHSMQASILRNGVDDIREDLAYVHRHEWHCSQAHETIESIDECEDKKDMLLQAKLNGTGWECRLDVCPQCTKSEFDCLCHHWGAHNLPPLDNYYAENASEVLGNEAKKWVASQAMLVGGGRKKKKGRKNYRANRSDFVRASPAFGVADRINNVKLTFRTNDLLNNASLVNPFAFSFFIVTNPILLNQGAATNEPFFTAYKAMYRKYRVRSYSVRATFMNSEAYGITGYASIVNFIPTNTLAGNQAAAQNCRKCNCSPKGGMDRASVIVRGSVRKAGFANTMVEDNFVSVTDGSSSPADNIAVVVGLDTNGVASVAGVLCEVVIVLHIDFMERQLPSS